MTFDWKKYLKLAEFINSIDKQSENENIGDEAFYRCTVSRAYYSAFCYTRNYAISHFNYKRPTENRKENAHNHLINFLRDNAGTASIGSRLLRLKEWRKCCDYCDTIPSGVGNIKFLSAGAIVYANEIIKFIDEKF